MGTHIHFLEMLFDIVITLHCVDSQDEEIRKFWCKSNVLDLHLSVLSWAEKDPDLQKIRIIELLFENKLHLTDGIPAVTIYSKYLRQHFSATPYLKV